ncbi:MAG TPA: TonB-dependent receptor [Sphingomicrobium sp.]|nr:TonB-dependent receptor [Sphingomicrobium sp.]
MTITRHMMIRALLLGASSVSLVAVATPAYAQLTTSTIRGTVSTGTAAAPGAVVTAVNVGTNSVTRATAGPDGAYVLTGLRPGTYDISASGAEGIAAAKQRVIIGVGETNTLNLNAAAPAAPGTEAPAIAAAGEILVVGRRLAETKTSEVATNVSQEQIENLPQNNRNFLNFANLAPGIKTSTADIRQTFAGGGVGAERNGEPLGGPQVNVFIDGVSLKSNLQQGGIVGQDASRGNPFSQLAVQEFRVLTSNFKAEYEDAGTAIITAITKSGTNDFHGEAFGTFQNDSMISRDFLQKRNNDDVKLKRYQFGAALGGPIIKDKLFFFINYEGNLQDRALTVTPGVIPAGETLPFDPEEFAGSFPSKFREHLGFAKLNWEINDRQSLEVSGSLRKETDFRDFGGQQAFSKASSIDNDVYTGKIRHQLEGDGFLNEFTVDYLKTKLVFGADFSAGFGQNYAGVIQIGGRADFQNPEQEGLTFRDNFSLKNVQWHGDHLIKAGGKLSFQNFSVAGSGPNNNPQFEFTHRPSEGLDFSFPELVRFGSGDPKFKADTTQFGLFVQDDWAVNDHLVLNLGLRWDVDTNARNRDFETPQRAVEALQALGADPRIQPAFYDVNDYISTGHNRKVDYNNIAPRIGFSYDLHADQRTVFFGGYGRFYDRTLYRNSAEESLLTQYVQSEIFFSPDGLPRNGRPTILWDPVYLTPEGFATLQNSLAATNQLGGELRVIPNDLQTPYTDQFSLGIRQRFGALRTSLTFNYIIGKDQVAYVPLNRTSVPNAGGFFDFIPMINGYGNAVAAFNERETRYKGVFLQIDKPYTKASGYGFGIAYTLAWSKGFAYPFNFDVPNFDFLEFQPNAGNERHRVVVNGIADLPWGFKASGLMTLASGVPALVTDGETNGFGVNIRKGNFGPKDTFFQLDLRLMKAFQVGTGEFQVWAEVFNLTNTKNGGQNDICCGPSAYGRADTLFGPPRSLQLGTAFRF